MLEQQCSICGRVSIIDDLSAQAADDICPDCEREIDEAEPLNHYVCPTEE